MNTHVRLVAILHIAFSAVSLLGAVALAIFLSMAGGIAFSQGEHQGAGVIALVLMAVCGFLLVLSLPGIIGGWALFTGRSWGRPLVLVLGALQLLNVPFGTALGIYTLIVLLQDSPSQPPPMPRLPSAA